MNDLYSGDVQAVFNAAYTVQVLCATMTEALTFDRGGHGPTSLVETDDATETFR